MAQSGMIQSVDRAMLILQVLREAEQPLALRDICEKIPLSKSTLFGLLNTLWANGMVRKTSDSKYTLGLKLFEYGSIVKKQLHLTEQARLLMRRLSNQTQATVVLSTRDKDMVLILEQISGKDSIRVALDIGSRLPLYCTSQGKCFLANMPDEERDQLLSQHPVSYTPYTILDRDELLKELQRVRWRGAPVYASGTSPFGVVLSWTEHPATSIRVSWRSGEKTDAILQITEKSAYERAGFAGAKTFAADCRDISLKKTGAWHYEATAVNLLPGTQYCYRVGADGAWSEVNSFTTVDPESESVTFAYFGDVQPDGDSEASYDAWAAFAQNIYGAAGRGNGEFTGGNGGYQ